MGFIKKGTTHGKKSDKVYPEAPTVPNPYLESKPLDLRQSMIKLDIASLRVGDKVHYQPPQYGNTKWENGMIKEIPTHTDESVRVVYNCNGEWYRYRDYTSALTNLSDLRLGWKHKED